MTFNWDERKNDLLKRTRGISFEEVVVAIEAGALLSVLAHPNPERYPNQRIYVVELHNYAYLVPFVRNSETEEIWLKTVYPSRKHTQSILRKQGDEDQ